MKDCRKDKIDYKSIGVTYKDECPDKERHINALVIPIMFRFGEDKEKCKVCGSPLWSEENMKWIDKWVQDSGILTRKFDVLNKECLNELPESEFQCCYCKKVFCGGKERYEGSKTEVLCPHCYRWQVYRDLKVIKGEIK